MVKRGHHEAAPDQRNGAKRLKLSDSNGDTTHNNDTRNNDAGNREANDASQGLMNRFPRKARHIVKFALLHHVNNKPIKKQAIRDEVEFADRAEFDSMLQMARKYLKFEMGMDLVLLPQVPLHNNRTSPQRHEYVLTRTDLSNSRLAKLWVAPKEEWGLLCFVLMLVVLDDDDVTFDHIVRTYLGPRRSPSESDIEIEEQMEELSNDLRPILASLVEQRFFEITKKENKRVSAGGDNVGHETQELYNIGPASKVAFKRSFLKVIFLKMVFPDQSVTSEQFQTDKKSYIEDMDEKLRRTCLD